MTTTTVSTLYCFSFHAMQVASWRPLWMYSSLLIYSVYQAPTVMYDIMMLLTPAGLGKSVANCGDLGAYADEDQLVP